MNREIMISVSYSAMVEILDQEIISNSQCKPSCVHWSYNAENRHMTQRSQFAIKTYYRRTRLQWHPREWSKTVTVTRWVLTVSLYPFGKSRKCHFNHMALYCVTVYVTGVTVSECVCTDLFVNKTCCFSLYSDSASCPEQWQHIWPLVQILAKAWGSGYKTAWGIHCLRLQWHSWNCGWFSWSVHRILLPWLCALPIG